MSKNAILLFWDQLTNDVTSLVTDKQAPVLLVESWDDFTHVAHHKKKIVFILSAMRHFASQLSTKRDVSYVSLADKRKDAKFVNIVCEWISDNKITKLIVTHPNEYRQLQTLYSIEKKSSVELELLDDDRFFCSIDAGKEWMEQNKNPLMENFYHGMRKQTGYLMENNKPMGGRWNYDKENRKPAKDTHIPHIDGFKPDAVTQEVMEFVAEHFSNNFGDIEPFWYAVTRRAALKALDRFVDIALAKFGDLQDAMLSGEPFMYHSVLSAYINIGLLTPQEVCDRIEEEYLSGQATLASAEGFIRQIIGWREYVRIIYWSQMPNYAKLNFFKAKNKLPEFYWTGDTKMNCLKQAINHTKVHAYSHHIQRLMITGNFAMLIGVQPKQIHEWYLIAYNDAYEWVEMPNTIGMATFADGGIMATKPYASGGNYINKMSNFCKGCAYKVSVKEGAEACPFNYLYWNFLLQHKPLLNKNQRLRMPYNTLAKMSARKIKQIEQDSEEFLKNLS